MKKLILLIATFSLVAEVFGQSGGKRMWLSGAARNVLYFDEYQAINEVDSLTAPKQNSGHTLVDLGVNIQPNENTYIHGMVRVRNDYGGFWGAGITFDVRQIYLKGIIAKGIRYQVGDINYKLTPYTLQNPNDDFEGKFLNYDRLYRDLIAYDLFYDFENAWRQQGAALDFAIDFDKVISEIKFNGFISRQNPSNFANISDRLLSGGNITLVQSEYAEFGINAIQMFDLVGTALDSTALKNPVITAQYAFNFDKNDFKYGLIGELGQSSTQWQNDANAPSLQDYFYDLGAKIAYKPIPVKLQVNYKNTGPKFFSPGAQTRRMNFNAPPAAYGRFGNAQQIRPIGMMDVLRDASIYQTTLTTRLQDFNPAYGNALPYGEATPNRRGIVSQLQFSDKEARFEIEANGAMLSEVVGQGTSELRNFNFVIVQAKLDVAKFIPNYKRQLELSAAYWMESTRRESALEFEKIDMQNNSIDFSIDAEFIKKGFIILGYRLLNSDGNEYKAERNNYQEIVNFTPITTNLNEQLLLGGFRYEFNEKNTLSILYSNYNTAFNASPNLNYQLSGTAIIYNMKF